MHRIAVPLTAVFTAASLSFAAGTSQSAETAPHQTPTPAESRSHVLPDTAVTAPVTIPLSAFEQGRDAARLDAITLDISSVDTDRASVGLVPARVESNAATSARVMTGSLSGETGRFVLAEVEGTVAGAVWTEDDAYDIRPVGDNGRVRLIRIDAINLPACATVGDAPPLNQVPFQQPVRVGSTNEIRGGQEDVIRVFVGFTEAGQAQMGGPNGANAVANAAIASCNVAYDNSAMSVGDNGALNCRLELVGTDGLILYDRNAGHFEMRTPQETEVFEYHHEKDFAGMYRAYAATLKTGEAGHLPTAAEGLRVTDLAVEVTRKVIQGKPSQADPTPV